jgi:tRNA threonylcarbamoyladenosine modification (KEOPS) complex  Pcc1 subunit
MKIRGTIEFKSPEAPDIAEKVALALSPDNLSSMQTEVREDSTVTHFSTEKITSLIATVDDYLMNAKIAEDIVLSVK